MTGSCATAGSCARAGEAFGHLRAVAPGVAVLVEHERDDGQPLDRFGGDVGEVDQAAERCLERPRDARLDLLGGEAGRLGLHHDELGREFREDVETGFAETHQPVADQHHGERQHHHAAFDREADEPGEHCCGGTGSASAQEPSAGVGARYGTRGAEPPVGPGAQAGADDRTPPHDDHRAGR
ncbi:MAG: hypothetical protein RKL32_06435 [Gammaproteobacteria bacterium]